ncbi:MAG: thioredoxin family protein [Thermoguttaceae bacterium]|jgi:small redox-active disulfide protein 2|nr:thioredoxin family protein [Thermoguttaceae bacterium]
MTKILEILGVGCPRCQALAENAQKAAHELGIAYELVRVTDVDAIVAREVYMTPALAVDGRVKAVGVVPSVEEIKQLLSCDEGEPPCTMM